MVYQITATLKNGSTETIEVEGASRAWILINAKSYFRRKYNSLDSSEDQFELSWKQIHNQYRGACIVLENYLDSAMNDLEEGNIENKEFIYDCIQALQTLGDTSSIDYLKRFNTAVKTA